MSDRRLARVSLVLASSLALACASGPGGSRSGSVQASKFPSQQELESVGPSPDPEEVFDPGLREVRAWDLEGRVPDRIVRERWLGRSPWDALLGEVADASGGRIVPTEAMHCVAREVARFALEHDGRPDQAVERFLVGGCNASVADVTLGFVHGEVPASVGEERIFEEWRAETRALLERQTGIDGPTVAGVAFARRGGRAVVFMAVGRALVELEPVATRIERGRPFELRGRALGPAESIHAAVNRGRFDVELCEPVGAVAPPAFHVACELDPGDDAAWVTLTITPPNRVLGRRALSALVSVREGAARSYRRFDYVGPRRIAAAEAFTPAFVEELNDVRERAGLHPVVLDAAESETATRLAPHFIAAMAGAGDEKIADTVALGLVAGWSVEGTVRRGGLAFGAVPRTDDLSVLLSMTLDEPMSRFALLDPTIERIAVGPIVSEVEGVPGLAVVVGGYALFDASRHGGAADYLFERLAAARRARELPPPYRLVNVWVPAMDAAADVGRGETPEYALDDLLEHSVAVLSKDVEGWYGETSDLDAFEFPDAYLSQGRLGAAIGVSHRKDPGDAWGRYVVVVVAVTH